MKQLYNKYLRLSLKHNKGLREVLIFVLFLIFYKFSRYIAIGDEETAFINAYKLVEFEKSLGIFNEVSVQQLFVNQVGIIKLINQFYMLAHIPVTVIFFMWLYHKKSSYYKFIRNGFLFANVLTLFFYINYPCAPPRMLNDLGFVDTLLEVSDVNLYTGMFSGLFNQYAAMPSMHFGNALLIGVIMLILCEKKPLKFAMMLYPLIVLFVIVVTGNHFYLDAIVGGVIVLIPYPIMYIKTYRAKKLHHAN